MDSHNLKFVNGLADYQQTSKGQTADVSLLVTSERLIDNSSISSTTFLLRLQHPNILGWCSWWLCYRKYLVHILFIGKKTYEKGKNRRNYITAFHTLNLGLLANVKKVFWRLNFRNSIIDWVFLPFIGAEKVLGTISVQLFNLLYSKPLNFIQKL